MRKNHMGRGRVPLPGVEMRSKRFCPDVCGEGSDSIVASGGERAARTGGDSAEGDAVARRSTIAKRCSGNASKVLSPFAFKIKELEPTITAASPACFARKVMVPNAWSEENPLGN